MVDIKEFEKGFIIKPWETSKRKFGSNVSITKEEIKECFYFACSMATGEKHNKDSFASGKKIHTRTNETIFRDAFQGKVAEVAFYNFAKDKVNLPKPDFAEWDLGKWEDSDFSIFDEKENKTINISVKSTKNYGNFLLLEKNRYNENAEYLEGVKGNTVVHDFIFLVRIKGIFSLYPNTYIKEGFDDITAEVSGYITHNDFKDAINKNQYFEAGLFLSEKEEMKVDNYFFCVNFLREKYKD